MLWTITAEHGPCCRGSWLAQESGLADVTLPSPPSPMSKGSVSASNRSGPWAGQQAPEGQGLYPNNTSCLEVNQQRKEAVLWGLLDFCLGFSA